jgi:hypothetical protein
MGETRRTVHVTKHAAEQFLARYPKVLGEGRSTLRDATAFVYGEVCRAIEEGRRSASEPSWLPRNKSLRVTAGRNRKLGGTKRYVWPPGRERAYLLKRGHAPEGGDHKWIVLTTFAVRGDT